MTFKCGICQEVSKPGESAVRLVVKMKEHEHSFRKNANKKHGTDDRGGKGLQIVREVLTCGAHIVTPTIK